MRTPKRCPFLFSMAILTVTKARIILGNLAKGLNDEEIGRHIKAAELLKSIYFDRNTKVNSKLNYNNKYGET